MNSKDNILANIRRHTHIRHDKPDLNIQGIQYPDKIAQFQEMIRVVGGECIIVDEGQNIDTLVTSLYPEAKIIASRLSDVSIATIHTDTVTDPHDLAATNLAIVEGVMGVAENGCVWIPQQERERAIYFIPEYLIILLDKEEIVDNMHEAYARLTLNEYGFGVFISGPSKTADIEQALVVGAHGAKGVTVLLR